jgi:hypothetical protein
MNKGFISAADLTRSDIDAVLERTIGSPGTLAGCRIHLSIDPTGPWAGLEEKFALDGALSAESPGAADIAILEGQDNESLAALAGAGGTAIVNAGNADENPLAALAVLSAIVKAATRIDGLRVGLCGDLHSHTEAHSLALLLRRFDVRLSFVSPAVLSMPSNITDEIRTAGIEIEETNDLNATLPKLDVLYLSPADPSSVGDRLANKLKALYPLSRAFFAAGKTNLYVCGDWATRVDRLVPYQAGARDSRYGTARALVAFLAAR